MDVGITLFTPRLVQDGSISTSKIADGAVTKAKLTSMVYDTDTATSYTNSTSTYSTIADVTITATGSRLVIIQLVPNSTSVASIVLNGVSCEAFFQLTVNGSSAYITEQKNISTANYSPGMLTFFHNPTAGSVTYALRGRITAGTSVQVNNCKLVAYEL